MMDLSSRKRIFEINTYLCCDKWFLSLPHLHNQVSLNLLFRSCAHLIFSMCHEGFNDLSKRIEVVFGKRFNTIKVHLVCIEFNYFLLALIWLSFVNWSTIVLYCTYNFDIYSTIGSTTYIFAIKTNFKNKTHQMMIESMNRNYSMLILYVLSKVPNIIRSGPCVG